MSALTSAHVLFAPFIPLFIPIYHDYIYVVLCNYFGNPCFLVIIKSGHYYLNICYNLKNKIATICLNLMIITAVPSRLWCVFKKSIHSIIIKSRHFKITNCNQLNWLITWACLYNHAICKEISCRISNVFGTRFQKSTSMTILKVN